MNDSKTFSPSATSCLAIDGSKIKSIRESKKLTQLYVATCLEVTVDTISRWENGRSPNIKFENAEKLAEVLEISLDDIADKTASTKIIGECDEQPSLQKPKPWWPLIAVGILLVFTYFQFSSPQKIKTQLIATRLIPQHASPHQPFPVLIKIEAQSGWPVSFILKDFLPEGCQPLRGEPTLVGMEAQKGVIKWLSSAEDEDPLYFAYLALAGSGLEEGQQLSFKGEVMIQGSETERHVISGRNKLAITNAHWADSNQDQRIDDEEILTIYNSFEVLQDLGVDIEEIRQIWAGKGYRWNPESKKFVVIP